VSLQFTDTGTGVLQYSASLSATGEFSLEDAIDGVVSGSANPSDVVTIYIDAVPVPGTATAAQDIAATLTLTTNAPAPNNQVLIPVTITPQGATLGAVTATWASATLGSAAPPVALTLQNSGNSDAAVTVTQPVDTDFGISASSFVVPANGSYAGAQATFTPSVVGTSTSSAGLAIAGPICNGGTPSATQIALTGTASGSGFVATVTTPLPALINCGTASPPSAVITVGNNTASSLSYTATLQAGSSSPFVVATANSPIASASTATTTVGVQASAVAQTATPGTVLSDTLILTPAASSGLSAIDVPLSVTVNGSVLTFGSATAFTTATSASPEQLSFAVLNSGNAAASPTLSIGGTNAADFSPSAPTLSPTSVAPGSTSAGQSSFNVTFTPPADDSSTKTASVTLTPGPNDVLCTPQGASSPIPAPLVLSGAGSTAGFQLTTPSNGVINFGNGGLVACPAGNVAASPSSLAQAATQTVAFTNTGNATMNWTASVATTNFSLSLSAGAVSGGSSTSGSLAPGSSQTVYVIPSPIAWPASTATNAYGDTLTIASGITGDPPHTIALNETAQGAIIATTDVASGFGTVYIGHTGSLSPAFDVVNTGNGSDNVTVTPTISAASGTDPGYPQYNLDGVTNAGFTLAVGSTSGSNSVAVNGVFTPGSNTDDAVASSVSESFTSDASPLCAPLPNTVTLTATGTDALVSYSPSSLSFNDVPCGTTASSQTILFSNAGNTTASITALALAAGSSSAFTAYIGTSGTTTGTIPDDNGSLPITVAPLAVPSSVSNPGSTSYTDTLTVTYVTGGTTNTATFDLTETPYGAVVSPSWEAVPNGVTLPSGYSATDVFWFGSAEQNLLSPGQAAEIGIGNSGNAVASIQLGFASGQSGPFNFPTSATSIPVGSNTFFTAYARPVSPTNPVNSTFAADGVFTVTGPNCGPSTFATTMVGEVSSPGQITSSGALSFGSVPCDSTQSALASTTVTLSSAVPYTYTWTASLPATATIGGIPSFTLSATTGTLNPGGGTNGTQTSSFTVTPNAAALADTTYPLGQPSTYFSTTVSVSFSSTNSGAPAQSTITIPVSVSPQGAVLAWSSGTFTYQFLGGGGSVKLANSGNEGTGAGVTLTLGAPLDVEFSGTPVSATYSPATVTASGSVSAPLTLEVFSLTAQQSVRVTTSGVVLCAPLPANATVTQSLL
jgi:hypothetical protein